MNFTEKLTKLQQDRQGLAQGIDQALVQLHAMDGKIQLLLEILAEKEAKDDSSSEK